MHYVPDTQENLDRCNCPGCPSNPDREHSLYCGRKPYGPHVEDRGCLCGTCPVLKMYDLNGQYYCEAPVH